MKFIATIDFQGIEGMPFRYYKEHVYELENNKTVQKLVKVGYLKEFKGFKEDIKIPKKRGRKTKEAKIDLITK
jgi:hypothetical protein